METIEKTSPGVLDDLENLLDVLPSAVLMLDAESRVRLVNRRAESMLDVCTADMGSPLEDVLCRKFSSEIRASIHEAIRSERECELEVDDLDGRRHAARVKPYLIRDQQQEGTVLSVEDIHELRLAQGSAVTSQTFAHLLAGSVQTPLVVLKNDFRVHLVNPAFHEHFGTQPEDLEEQFFLEIQHNRFDLDGLRDALGRILEEQTDFETLEVQAENSGARKHVSITVKLVQPATEKMLLLALNDITARKEAERVLIEEHERLRRKIEAGNFELEQSRRQAQSALQESRIELLRSREELRHLTASLLHAQDEERRRVSRELHDDLSQKVAKLQFDIERLEQNVPFSDLEAAREKLRKVRDEAATLSEDLRRVAHQLHPSTLDHLGLVVAMRSFIDEFSQSTNIPVEFSSHFIPKELPIATASCVYRIVQEALRNVAKHANEANVEVELGFPQQVLTLLVRDDGRGFDKEAVRAKGGLGLIGIEERVRLVGGTMNVDSDLGCGTSIRVRIPLA